MESRLDIAAKIAEELEIKKWQVEAVIKLIDDGNTIPFISRKRFSPLLSGRKISASVTGQPYLIF